MQIPIARDLQSNRIVTPDRAIRKAPKGRYQCIVPGCQHDLTVAISKYGRVHFRHFRGMVSSGCSFHSGPKSRTHHNTAQQLLMVLLSEALARRAPMPTLVFETTAGIKTALPIILGRSVVTEWVCPFTNRRADLAILDDFGRPVLLVEVFHTHAVDHNKRDDLSPYWWIEVNAIDVLENSSRLIVRAHGNFPYEYELLGYQGDLFLASCSH